MSKRRRRKAAQARAKRTRQQQRHQQLLLDDDDLQQVVAWKARIEQNIQAALACYRWLEEANLQAHEHAPKSLEKYVENTTESIKQLDNLTHRQLFAALVEIPEDSADQDVMTWRNMIGMRDRLTHRFWETDRELVATVVRDDFSRLGDLFAQLQIVPVGFDGALIFEIPTSAIVVPREIYRDGDPWTPGNAYIVAVYARRKGWMLARLVKRDEPDVVQFVDVRGRGMSEDGQGGFRMIWRK